MSKQPDYHQHEEFQNRMRKLKELRELNLEPFPHKFEPDHSSESLHLKYNEASLGHSDDAAAGTTPKVRIAGRLVLFRAMGKNAFAHVQDDTGRIQVMFNRDLTQVEGYTQSVEKENESPSPIKLIEKKIDLGDIIGVEGNLFFTNKGELTIFVKNLTILCKTLLPLPDKHAGLADKELRYRKRWLDLISNPEVRQTFRTRSLILSEIRNYFAQFDFIEVETPVLQSSYGGAEARPFLTKLNALDQEMFLRISLEISLKKLIIGGMNRVFEMGKVFRNEGIDRNHNPEFTLLEAYASYWDYQDMMQFVETLFEKLALQLYGTTKIQARLSDAAEEIEIELKAPWKRLTMKESIKQYADLDVDSLNDEQMRKMLEESGHVEPKKLKSLSHGLLIAAIFEVMVEPHLIQPHHITDHPIETTPLCKLHRDPTSRQNGLVERFESFILRQEVCNAYSELNDPILQRDLLELQAARKEAGDDEASPLDEEFIEAICQGMPPTGGIGIGIDRLVMLLTNSHSIRDVLYFPWMKPQSS
jgi:lysyl-tRNA synthetase, class II